MIPMACQCRPKFRHWLPWVTIVTNVMTMFTNDYQCFVPLAANLERRQNYQRAKGRHFKMTINENDEQIDAEMKEMTTIFSVSMGANTRFSKCQKRFLILSQLCEFHIYCILLIFTGFPS